MWQQALLNKPANPEYEYELQQVPRQRRRCGHNIQPVPRATVPRPESARAVSVVRAQVVGFGALHARMEQRQKRVMEMHEALQEVGLAFGAVWVVCRVWIAPPLHPVAARSMALL